MSPRPPAAAPARPRPALNGACAACAPFSLGVLVRSNREMRPTDEALREFRSVRTERIRAVQEARQGEQGQAAGAEDGAA